MKRNWRDLKGKLEEFMAAHQDEMKHFFLDLVRQYSGTFDKEGVDLVGQIIVNHLSDLNLKVTARRHPRFGDLIVVRSSRKKGWPKLLISGHSDTVFEPKTGRGKRGEERKGFIFGPGACDMKGGLVIGVYTLKALSALGQLFNVDFMITPDEEQGSKAFRRVQKRLYRGYDYAFVLEGAGQQMEVCLERKGVGSIAVEVFGRAGHSGHKNPGANAIEELALKIPQVLSLKNEKSGTTFNVGIVSGGTKINVVASSARADFDFRYSLPSEVDRVKRFLKHLEKKTFVKGTKIRTVFEVFSPPMLSSSRSKKLFIAAQKVGSLWLGQRVHSQKRGGGSDGNLIAQTGVGVLDGLGILGRFIHTDNEQATVSSINERVLLLSGVILSLQE